MFVCVYIYVYTYVHMDKMVHSFTSKVEMPSVLTGSYEYCKGQV